MIIPGINCRDFETAAVQIKKISEFSEWAHIDVVDGVFAPNVTWRNTEEFSSLALEFPLLRFEIHLMVTNPEEVLEGWLKAGAERVIIHLETMKNPHFILDMAKKSGGEVMLASSPQTAKEILLPYLNSFSFFQVLAVPPGLAGQKFNLEALEKIKFLRERKPDATIEVDGGINPEVAKLAKEAGANILASVSYIMNSPDPKGAYEELNKETGNRN